MSGNGRKSGPLILDMEESLNPDAPKIWTEVALKNDGCRGHYWDWVTQYQKDNCFSQRWSLQEVIDKGKKAIDWDHKWHAPGTKRLANGKMHGMGFMSINEWACTAGSRLACLMLRDGN